MHLWHSKQVLKTGKDYQVPTWVKNRPKAVAKADWDQMVKEFKYNKLVVLDKVPKSSRKANNNITERKNKQ
jgi:hypothetical protein